MWRCCYRKKEIRTGREEGLEIIEQRSGGPDSIDYKFRIIKSLNTETNLPNFRLDHSLLVTL